MTQINHLRPMLAVKDVKATLQYYVDTLGFTLDDYVEMVNWGEVHKDNVYIMFCGFNSHMGDTASHLSGSIYLNTNDVQAWWELLKDKAEILYELKDFPYNMREFAIKDCNGYVLQFGQEI